MEFRSVDRRIAMVHSLDSVYRMSFRKSFYWYIFGSSGICTSCLHWLSRLTYAACEFMIKNVLRTGLKQYLRVNHNVGAVLLFAEKCF
ncbi:hypothetical protein HAPAU_31470 [Halalkalicoccus paucihalophilus]|uniref:Uncharacterized protein n=1 Tax=Halalkalicoccus paucihalophilus TaxID=1008153 RepID=A0A151AB41_9EURY|nr:hypothetical protein HAPAU_31470 [Halalkalicoccus paucihalophilus]